MGRAAMPQALAALPHVFSAHTHDPPTADGFAYFFLAWNRPYFSWGPELGGAYAKTLATDL